MTDVIDIEGQLVVETEYRAQVRAYRKNRPGELGHTHSIQGFDSEPEISVGGKLTDWFGHEDEALGEAYALAFGYLSTGAEWVTVSVESQERVTL